MEGKPYVEPAVNHREVMAASARLDTMLTQATKELKMAGHGAGKSVREILESSKREVATALTQFAESVAAKNREMAQDIVENGRRVVQKMEEDHRETRDAFIEMLGNEVALSDDHKSDSATGQ